MKFKTDELLLLENLTYFTEEKPLSSVIEYNGKTVGELINSIDTDKLIKDHDYATCMNGFDFVNLILAFKNNKRLMETKIIDSHIDEAYGGGGGLSVVFINDNINEAVVAFRGTALNEWLDDFVGANQTDSLQQINALEWYKKMYNLYHLEKYTVTVTGHSKGGNKAKYITLIDDTPSRCVSFDGQGFSDIFIEDYKERIIKRAGLIENHNVDYDYVNILLNDIGHKTYYHGYDYGKGGFAESHCPNTFFNFKENGEYEIKVNPNGQAPEMQIMDQFINSMVRSALNEKEKDESNYVVGAIVEKAFGIGVDGYTTNDFIYFMIDSMGNEQYSDNIAYLLVFVIKYTRENPELIQAFKDVVTHFHMEGVIKILDMLNELVNSSKINTILNLSNFLVLHANKIVVKKLQSIAKKKYDIDLSQEQIKKVLKIVSLAKGFMNTLELAEDGSDITVDFDTPATTEEFQIPEQLDIVILAGGLSNERNVSFKTGFAVRDALIEKGHNVILLDSFMGYSDEEMLIDDPFSEPDKYSLKDFTFENDIADLWAVKKRRVDKSENFFGPNVLTICKKADLVFIALHGANGENGKIQAVFDLLGIDYTGCNSFSSAITLNKAVAKLIMSANDIPVSKGFALRKTDRIPDPKDYKLIYPLVVKPCNGGVGVGVSVVSDKKAYEKALKNAFKWENEVVVEEYVHGRQFEVSILNGRALPISEVLPLNATKNTGLSITGKEIKKCPAEISEVLAETLSETAIQASKALGINGYSLTDFIVRPDGSFVCLECDTLPELTEDSPLALACEAEGISFSDLCEKIIELSLIK